MNVSGNYYLLDHHQDEHEDLDVSEIEGYETAFSVLKISALIIIPMIGYGAGKEVGMGIGLGIDLLLMLGGYKWHHRNDNGDRISAISLGALSI